MGPCQPKKDSGVVRSVGAAGFVMAHQSVELTTMTQPCPPALNTTTNTTPTPTASSSLGAMRTPSPPPRFGRASAPSPSPEGPRGRRGARAPSPSPDRSKRIKTRAVSPSPSPLVPVRTEPVRTTTTTTAPPPTPSSVSSPSPFSRPAPESTPPATFSFAAAPPAAQTKPKPKSSWQALLDEAFNAPRPAKPRAYPEGNIPFGPSLRMNEAPARSAPTGPLQTRFPGLSQPAAAPAPPSPAASPSPVAPPPPPSSPPKDKEIDRAPAASFAKAALPARLTPPPPQQQPAARPPPPSQDVEIVDAPPSAQDEDLGDAPPEEESPAFADIGLWDAPVPAEAPYSVDAGELLDADDDKEDEILPDAEPAKGLTEATADEEQLPDASPQQVEAANPDFDLADAPPASPKSASPAAPTSPIRPLSPTAEPVASSARCRRGKAHRSGRQRRDQETRRNTSLALELKENLEMEKQQQEKEAKEQRFADLEAKNAGLVEQQARSSEHIAALEAKLARARESAVSASKARDQAQSKADELDKKLTCEVAADEATKLALAKVNAELESAHDTVKALKDEKAKLNEHIVCIESDHAYELDVRDSLAEEWEQKLSQLEQRAQDAEAELETTRQYVIDQASLCEALQRDLDATKNALEQEILKAEDLQSEMGQQKRKSESDTRNFRFALHVQTKKVMTLTDANRQLTADNRQLQQDLNVEVVQVVQLAEALGDQTMLESLNRRLQEGLKQHVGATRMPKQQQAGPSKFSYKQLQRELNGAQKTSSKIMNEVQGAYEMMELEMATAAKANRSKGNAIKELSARLANAQAHISEQKAVLASYESAAPPPSSPLPAASPARADKASTALMTMPSSSAAPSAEASPQFTEPATVVTGTTTSSALPTTTTEAKAQELEELVLKTRDDLNSRIDRFESGIDAFEASMNKSRTRAGICSIPSLPKGVASSIGKSVSSIFGHQPLHFCLMLLFFLYLLTLVAIGHSMQEELWSKANTLSRDASLSPARTQTAAYGQVTVLVLFVIDWWRS